MRVIALEEAWSDPELARRHPGTVDIGAIPVARWFAEHNATRLPDTTDLRLADMDAHGVTRQVLSLTSPGLQAAGLSPADAITAAREANDRLAAVIGAHPDRFSGFAAVPLQDPEAAAVEARRAVSELGFCGVLVNDHTDGRYLDDAVYEQVWDALCALDVPLYLHPGALPVDRWAVVEGCPELVGPSWSWGAQVSAHVLRLVYAGVFDRHPTARVIAGHMGEMLPFMASRLDSRYRTLDPGRSIERRPSEYLGTNVVLTTSGVTAPAALAGAVLAVGASAVAFAIDYPYEETGPAVAALRAAPVSQLDLHEIAHGNAERWLGIDPA